MPASGAGRDWATVGTLLRYLLGLLSLLVFAAPACTSVRFNERARLPQPAMIFERDGLAADVRRDITTTREGAVGGFNGGAAGGCGCT